MLFHSGSRSHILMDCAVVGCLSLCTGKAVASCQELRAVMYIRRLLQELCGHSCRSYLILACVKCQLWWIVTTVVHRQALSERNVISWIYVQTGWQIPVLPIAQKAEATAELCLQILQCFLTSSSGAEVTTEAQWELAQGQADISLTGHKKNNSDALKSAKHQGLMFFLFYLFTVIIKLLRQECSQSLFMVVN